MNQCKNHSVYSFLKTNKQMEKQTKNHKTKTQQQKPKKTPNNQQNKNP